MQFKICASMTSLSLGGGTNHALWMGENVDCSNTLFNSHVCMFIIYLNNTLFQGYYKVDSITCTLPRNQYLPYKAINISVWPIDLNIFIHFPLVI